MQISPEPTTRARVALKISCRAMMLQQQQKRGSCLTIIMEMTIRCLPSPLLRRAGAALEDAWADAMPAAFTEKRQQKDR